RVGAAPPLSNPCGARRARRLAGDTASHRPPAAGRRTTHRIRAHGTPDARRRRTRSRSERGSSHHPITRTAYPRVEDTDRTPRIRATIPHGYGIRVLRRYPIRIY